MRILHICLCGPVTDNWNYQDNLITKYHKKLGHDVTIIASQWIYNQNGLLTLSNNHQYTNDDGVKMIRLPIMGRKNFRRKFKRYIGLYNTINNIKPDVIFVHGCQFLDIKDVVRYVSKYPDIKVFVDNHADLKNSATNWVSKNILHKYIWKYCAQKIQPYVSKFWGVLPARVDFLIDIYDLSKEKVDLLVMGADDEKVSEVKSDNSRQLIRHKYNIKQDDFLLMTGGKIDSNKTQTLILMEAIKGLSIDNVKLIVFGSISKEYQEKFNKLLDDKVQYIGWVDSKETYTYFNAADLIIFPGLHSVFWEQAVGLGQPCVFRYMEGFTHVDVGGNCQFLYEDSVDEINRVIKSIVENKELYLRMRQVAIKKGMEKFSYEKIAYKSIVE